MKKTKEKANKIARKNRSVALTSFVLSVHQLHKLELELKKVREENKQLKEQLRKAKQDELFEKIQSNITDISLNSKGRDEIFLNSAFTLMTENYSNSEFDLGAFVDGLGFSKTYINQKLKDLTGMTIGQFMKSYRIKIAKELIIKSGGTINIVDVSFDVGFNDPKYFSKCFKKIYGILPSQIFQQSGQG